MARAALEQKARRDRRGEATDELVITLDADEYEALDGMARQMGMTTEELARHIIEQSLDQYQARVVDGVR
jgi:hypothetical protein